MSIRSALKRALAPALDRSPKLRDALVRGDATVDRVRNSVATVLPQIIRPDPRVVFITLTANCNYRCKACHYGRDFMPGHQLPLPLVRDLLDDIKDIGIPRVRLYGGEPLLHKQLPEIVEHTSKLGLDSWVTTNGFLLRERVDDLFSAGLRTISIGSYGTGAAYNEYTQRDGYERMEAGVAYTRERYGQRVKLSLDWLLMKPTCSVESLHETWRFAKRYRTPIRVSLIHYSLPYFLQAHEEEEQGLDLSFKPQDRPEIERVVSELLRLKETDPALLPQNDVGLRSIPDWLIERQEMRVPCDRYRLIWIGADGTVQMCYVTFKLGNLHEQRLRDLVFTPTHKQAARDAFALNCPNCHCGYYKRTLAHGPTRRRYLDA